MIMKTIVAIYIDCFGHSILLRKYLKTGQGYINRANVKSGEFARCEKIEFYHNDNTFYKPDTKPYKTHIVKR